MSRFFRTCVAAVMVSVLVACTSQTSSRHVAPGLVEVDQNRYFDRILLAPDQQLPAIQRIYIEEPSVSMNKQWLKNYRSDYTEADLQRIKTRYGDLLMKSLENQILLRESFALAETAAEADVIFRPTLEALNIYGPDLSNSGDREHYIHAAGNATFNLLLLDPSSGVILAQFIDHHETFSNPARFRERTNRITNARYFRRLMDRWAQNLMNYLADVDRGRLPE